MHKYKNTKYLTPDVWNDICIEKDLSKIIGFGQVLGKLYQHIMDKVLQRI